MTFFKKGSLWSCEIKALCSQAENLPSLRDTVLKGISGGIWFSDGSPKVLGVRNVDYWNLRMWEVLPGSCSLESFPWPPGLCASHNDLRVCVVSYRSFFGLRPSKRPCSRISQFFRCTQRKIKTREELQAVERLRVTEAETYAHFIQQVAVRSRG